MPASSHGGSGGPALAVRNLVKYYGGLQAVDDVSFSLPGGLFLSLLGPSGSGKTTILRILGGFESPDRGTIEINGADVGGLPPYRREIGMVFQRYALFPHMNVADNVGFSLKQRGVAKAARAARVEEILEAVGLSGYGGRRTAQLSGGQQQRVALARALIFKPRILVMDEPLAALDKHLREHMQQEIRSLQRRLRITTVYVTHDQTEAFAMSDLVAVMNAGRIEQLDAPRVLYETPRSEFVARFVGESNLFRGAALAAGEGHGALRLSNGTLLRYVSSSDRSAQVTLLVRPEKIIIHRDDAAHWPANVLRGRVVDAMFLGEAVHYRIAAAGYEVSVREQGLPGAASARPGDEVTLCWSVADTVALR